MCRKNKSTDHLPVCYYSASDDLCLCFRICKLQGFAQLKVLSILLKRLITAARLVKTLR